MNQERLREWFDDLAGRTPRENVVSRYGLQTDAVEWVSEVGAAIAAAFPASHQIVRAWNERLEMRSPGGNNLHSDAAAEFTRCEGVFRAAHRIFDADRVGTLAEEVRREAERDLLDTAEDLRSSGYLIAAVVLVGGALEVHLRGLCERTPNLPAVRQPPSIANYNAAIAQARNAHQPVPYDVGDGQQVIAWGIERNHAAHTPDRFNQSAEQVALMLQGVRDFINRTR